MAFLPMPEVPALDANNSVDADAVVDSLVTLLSYPGIAVGDLITVDFRGCGPDGTPSDLLTVRTQIDQLDADGKYAVKVPKLIIDPLKGGWVFYSYSRFLYVGTPREIEEFSQRRFFYVNRVLQSRGGLPVMLLRESHDLLVVLDELDNRDAQMLVLPYQAMAEGDSLQLRWRTIDPDYGDEWDSGSVTHLVEPEDVGRPVLALLPYAVLDGGLELDLQLDYSITYSGSGASSESPTQTLRILAEREDPTPLLPPPSIREVPSSDGTVIIDPDLWPDGVTVEIEPYADMADEDGVALYMQQTAVEADGVRLDLTTVESQRLVFHLGSQWLVDHRGVDTTLTYQYAREGHDARSQPLTVSIMTRMVLPSPSVERAVPTEPGKDFDGAIDGWTALNNGTAVLMPSDLDLPTNAKLKVHWKGFTPTGSREFPLPLTQPRCPVPSDLIPANLDRVVEVYYSVNVDDEHWQPSDVYRLSISDTASRHLPTLECPNSDKGDVSLAKVSAQGLEIVVPYWKGMAAGQWVTLEVHGLVGGANKTFYPRNKQPVSQDEAFDEQIVAYFDRAQLQTLALNQRFEIHGSVSFDDGASFKPFGVLQLTLVA